MILPLALTAMLAAQLDASPLQASRRLAAVESRYTGGALPDGLHLEYRTFRGLWVGGLSAFLIAYVSSAVASALIGSWHMFIPVYGQVRALQAGAPVLSAVLLTADAIAEVAGLALFVTGLCVKMPYIVRDTTDWGFALVPNGLGVSFVATH